MKKIVIAILSVLGYLGIKKLVMRELVNYALRRYISINQQLDVPPKVALEALQAMLKDVKERREYHQKELGTAWVTDPRKLQMYMEWLYRNQVNVAMTKHDVNKAAQAVLKEMADEKSVPKDPIAQQAINFVNTQAAKNGKPLITDEDVAATQKQLRDRGMLS